MYYFLDWGLALFSLCATLCTVHVTCHCIQVHFLQFNLITSKVKWCKDGRIDECVSKPYLLQELWRRVSCQDDRGHVWTNSVELLNLSPPYLQQPIASFIYTLPPRPLTLQVERKACILPLSPAKTR